MRDFALGDVLSITTARLVSRRHMEGVYDILNFMTGDNLFTHQLPRAMKECQPWLLRQHPQLANIPEPEVNAETWLVWLEEQESRFGTILPIAPIPRDDHTRKDPVTELEDMIGKERVIVIDPGDEHV